MANRQNRKPKLRRSRRNRLARQNLESKPRRRRINRVAQQKEGDQIHVFDQTNGKGYDVEMIRDFLENRLLEVRVQHYENLKGREAMEKYGDVRVLRKVQDENTSPALVEQLRKYLEKYETQLIFVDVIDGENATQTEIDIVTEAFLGAATIKRDEQIGHLEALQELFDEALTCAEVPFGALSDGSLCRPTSVFCVREWIDQQNQDDASLPT